MTQQTTRSQRRGAAQGTDRRRQGFGAYGERVAEALLVEAGMVVLDRNWRCDAGELDLVLRDGDVAVFCEVKTRRTTDFGSPLEAVGPAKAARLRVLALRWLEAHDLHPGEIRVDLVGVLQDGHGRAEVEHVRAVG